MAIEKQSLSAVPMQEEAIELEIIPQAEEETELFVQPDGSIIRGSEMPDQATSKFGENLAETLDELNVVLYPDEDFGPTGAYVNQDPDLKN